jgi:hypothetical protein
MRINNNSAAKPAPVGLDGWKLSDGMSQPPDSEWYGKHFWWQRKDGWVVLAVPEDSATLVFPFELSEKTMPDPSQLSAAAQNFGVMADKLQNEPHDMLSGTSETLAEVGLGLTPQTDSGLFDGWFNRGLQVESPVVVAVALMVTVVAAFLGGKIGAKT